ncbi:PEP-CTERM sorting domain-containing protein [Cylindrospermum sp. FACHB-282]|uniref:PEP-CTERM sorting domain-containing protein n=1 Tax=Cylindrospermum sp. FACHB-282 TaxID=2692794 RepID=UPI0016838CF2|nr:PEP-CTERM sorting domain-containing protein [Cylindrospermum sp. FACHB-282]MBD2383862.1 PEP-CTERM sorting domain-containing protein [Cylindrospermum sp. FACHB-282]
MSVSHLIKHSAITTGILSLASFGLAASPSQAVSVDFSSWDKLGDVYTQPGEASLSNDNANFQDDSPQASGYYNLSGNNPEEASPNPNLQDFLGLDAESLDDDGQAYEGSAIKSVITAQAGDKLSFEWRFSTNETSNKDFGFFLVNNNVIKLADFTNALQSGTSGSFQTNTGFNTFSYTFNSAGTYNLGFGVVDVGDYVTSSALDVKNGNLEEVPEPTTIVGSLILVSAGLLERSRKKARK